MRFVGKPSPKTSQPVFSCTRPHSPFSPPKRKEGRKEIQGLVLQSEIQRTSLRTPLQKTLGWKLGGCRAFILRAQKSASLMLVTVGSGSRKYDVPESWAKLPEGWVFKDAAGVTVDQKDRVY